MPNALDDDAVNRKSAPHSRAPMATAMKVAQALLGLAGLALIGLGFGLWSGRALNFVPLHEQLGIFIVVELWVLAGIGAVYGVSRIRVAIAVVWGFVVIGFGFAQAGMMLGDLHWTIRILHLLVGLVALWQGAVIAKQISVRSEARVPLPL